MSYTDEEIAAVCHEANRGIQMITNDPHPNECWLVSAPEVKQMAIDGVQRARQGVTPRELHAGWIEYKRERGWVAGPVKDEVARTHPDMVDYADLPPQERLKDEVFLALVALLASA